jgi:predicted nucleic acid-binding protein
VEKLDIYLDTNVVKKINSNFFKFEFNDTYYNFKRFLQGNNIDYIKVYVPYIVIEELITQYIEDYKSIRDNVENNHSNLLINAERLNWEVKLEKKNDIKDEKYIEVIELACKDFINEEQDFLNIIDHPSSERLKKIIERAVKKRSHFFKAQLKILRM